MNRYSVKLTKSAKGEIDALPAVSQARVIDVIGMISINPFSEALRAKKLKGAASLYRIRVGDYRVVYEVMSDAGVILVIKIGHRKDVYRRL